MQQFDLIVLFGSVVYYEERIPAMKYIDEVQIAHKTILVRVDFNVSLNPNHSIADDARIKQSIPTLEYLLNTKTNLS